MKNKKYKLPKVFENDSDKIKVSSDWEFLKKGKVGDHSYAVYSIDFKMFMPTKVDAHAAWNHYNHINKENPSLVSVIVDHFTDINEDEFLIYRTLMLEAGYIPHYLWMKEKDQTQTWIHPDGSNLSISKPTKKSSTKKKKNVSNKKNKKATGKAKA